MIINTHQTSKCEWVKEKIHTLNRNFPHQILDFNSYSLFFKHWRDVAHCVSNYRYTTANANWRNWFLILIGFFSIPRLWQSSCSFFYISKLSKWIWTRLKNYWFQLFILFQYIRKWNVYISTLDSIVSVFFIASDQNTLKWV